MTNQEEGGKIGTGKNLIRAGPKKKGQMSFKIESPTKNIKKSFQEKGTIV